ncbi:MAG: hypothetical protein PVG03_17920 [Desulfarculaceae bacterium]|jgi:hypothetical protein
MNDDDLIAGLHKAVKREVIEHYLRQRRITEEEIRLVMEKACAFHGGLALWEKAKQQLIQALLNQETAGKFCIHAGLRLPGGPSEEYLRSYPRPKGATRCRRFLNLIQGLYQDIYDQARQLKKEKQKLKAFVEEVNRDISTFENNYDMLSIFQFLRSLEPFELERRKLLGVNFTAKETSKALAKLSFQPIALETLALDHGPEALHSPLKVIPKSKRLLKDACRRHPQAVDSLWA